MTTLDHIQLSEVLRLPHATCYSVDAEPNTLLVRTTGEHIPKTQFQELFIAIGHVIVNKKINTLVFDMRSLSIFPTNAMEWYHLVWTELMYYHGLQRHRIIQPKNELFREAAQLSREKLMKHHAEAKFIDMDIRNADTLQQAIGH